MVCNSFPGLKRTAFPGGIETSAPVRGLRPIPVLRGRTLKTPNPRSSMRSPLESDRFILSKTVSTAISALVLVMPVRLTTSLMMSSLITFASSRRSFGCDSSDRRRLRRHRPGDVALILDTNAISAVADQDPAVVVVLAHADEMSLPVLAIGEYRYGISQSRHKARFESWLEGLILDCRVLDVDEGTTREYAG